MSPRPFRALLVAVLGTVATLSSGCSTDVGSSSTSTADDQGSIGLALQLASGPALNSVAYTITGPGGFSRTGTIDTSHGAVVSALISNLPVGSGFSITLDGTTADGGTHCAGAATFAVVGRTTTTVSVHLTCHEPPRAGSVMVNGTINVCPTVDDLTASPREALVGSSIALAPVAHDTDSGPAALAYHWTTTGGTLSAADVQSPSLTCTALGIVTVTVTATDGNCADTLSTAVTCTGSSMDLSKYARVGRYNLPEPTRTTPPNGTSLLAQEASAVTYNWDTDTLFVSGDGGTSVVQVSKTGA